MHILLHAMLTRHIGQSKATRPKYRPESAQNGHSYRKKSQRSGRYPYNRSCPPDLLEQMATSDSEDVRSSVYMNPAVEPTTKALALAHPGNGELMASAVEADRERAAQRVETSASLGPLHQNQTEPARFRINRCGRGDEAFSVVDTQVIDPATSRPAVVGYILPDAAGKAVFRAYHNGAKDSGPLAPVSRAAVVLDAGMGVIEAVAKALVELLKKLAELQLLMAAERERREKMEHAARDREAQGQAASRGPVATTAPPAHTVASVGPPALAASAVVGKEVFWPLPRAVEGADTSKLEARRAEKMAEIKGRADPDLMADRAATKAKIAALVADGNPAGARGYEQGLAAIDAEAKARGLIAEQPAVQRPAQRSRGGRGD